ncbi:hypothetical protein VTN77DRAFT_6515 [Rasamsonia byssochlamydoides]|uniref:uncharacterized protein n=1 Tax=Rasamsonia byssochlamydoides TaxID=89139 RepID=UPI003744071F
MSAITKERVEKILAFDERGRRIEKQYEEVPLSPEAIQSYHRKLDDTIKGLQGHIKRQEDVLRKLRASKQGLEVPRPGSDLQARLAQTRRAKKAYDALLQSEPDLPAPDSPLPLLLALRETSRVVEESKASVANLQESLAANRQRLKSEEDDLRDAKLITQGLEDRIQRLQEERAQKATKDPSQLATELIEAERKRNAELDRATAELRKALDRFVDEHLASMLAAEDLGGPTVGDAMDIPDATLEAGYTHHGKPKKPKSSTQEDDEDPTQQRIDRFIRRERDGNEAAPANKREAAAAEMRSLLDSLLEAGSSYIDLPRESAASRFLVRAKVAQLHPRDARRIRLIDFGRTLED